MSDAFVVQLPRSFQVRDGSALSPFIPPLPTASPLSERSESPSARALRYKDPTGSSSARDTDTQSSDASGFSWHVSIWRRLPAALAEAAREPAPGDDSIEFLLGDDRTESTGSAVPLLLGGSVQEDIRTLSNGCVRVTEVGVMDWQGRSSTNGQHADTLVLRLPEDRTEEGERGDSQNFVIRMDAVTTTLGLVATALCCCGIPPRSQWTSTSIQSDSRNADTGAIPTFIVLPGVPTHALVAARHVATDAVEAVSPVAITFLRGDLPGAAEVLSVANGIPSISETETTLVLACEPVCARTVARQLVEDPHLSPLSISAFSIMVAVSKGNGELLQGPFLLGGGARIQSSNAADDSRKGRRPSHASSGSEAGATASYMWKYDTSPSVGLKLPPPTADNTDVHLMFYTVIPPGYMSVSGVFSSRPVVVSFSFLHLTRRPSPPMSLTPVFVGHTSAAGQGITVRKSGTPGLSHMTAEVRCFPGCPSFLPADDLSGEALFQGFLPNLTPDCDVVPASTAWQPWSIPAHLRLSSSGACQDPVAVECVQMEEKRGALPSTLRLSATIYTSIPREGAADLVRLLSAASSKLASNPKYTSIVTQMILSSVRWEAHPSPLLLSPLLSPHCHTRYGTT
jgi:hypothetical protein